MAKKKKEKVEVENQDVQLQEQKDEQPVAMLRARVLEDFAFQVKMSPFSPSFTQIFKRNVIITNTALIKQMLESGKPISVE